MSLGGQYGEPSAAVVVYGPDGTAYGSPAQARAAGVENYSMQQPVGGQMLPGFGGVTPMPSPDMPRFGISRPQEFNQYGYSAPQVRQQMGEGMNLQPSDDSIIDSSYLAQLGILNQPQVLSAQADALGSGLINVPGSGGKGGGAPLIQDYRGLANRFKSDAAAKSGGLMAATGAGGGGDYYGGGGGDLYTYDPQLDAQGGGSRAPDWVGLPADMAHRNFMGDIFGYQDPAPVYNMNTGTTDYANIGNPTAGMGGADQGSAGSTAATRDMPDGPDGANASSGGCVIATHAVSSGAFTPREKRQAELWCIKKLHNKWWGEAIRRGYRYHGNASIKGGRAATHYQEFRDFVDFGSGKRRNAKTAFTFAWRSVQFFFTGLLVKS